MRVRFYLNGIEINPPNNFAELEIELNYDTDGNSQALKVNDWDFGVGDPSKGNDGLIMLRNHYKDTTGSGVVEAVPFKIIIDNERGDTYELFDGSIDGWSAKYKLSGSKNIITATAIQAGKIDWLNDRADSFSFDYLYFNGNITRDKFVNVPYVVVKKQDVFEIAMTLVTIFILIDKLKEQINDVAQLGASTANPLEFTAIIRFIIKITYLVTLFVSLVTLILKLFYLLMPPVKYHKGMFVRDLFEAGCNYLGLKFKSSILQQGEFRDLFLLPEKYNLTENITGIVAGDFRNNNESLGFYKGTFGDFIRAFKTMFYAKVVIDNDTLYFEPYNFKLGQNGINVPYTEENESEFTLNWEDFKSNMTLSFLTDMSDRHTIQEYTGTSVQFIQTTKAQIPQKYSLLRNLQQEQIPFALAKRKTSLTTIESILSEFLKVGGAILTGIIAAVNAVIDALNALIKVINKILKALRAIGIKIKADIKPIKKIKNPNIGNLISNRIGMLKMESDYVNIPKVFILNQSSNPVNTKIGTNNETIVSAKNIFLKYHYLKSFASIDGKETGQRLLRESDQFFFGFNDFINSLNNNTVFTPDGLEGEAISLRFNPQTQLASCTYKQKVQYLHNLKYKTLEPDGK